MSIGSFKKNCLFVIMIYLLTVSDILLVGVDYVAGFEDRLKELRQQRGITQRELACYLNIAHSTVAQYETGKRMPDAEMLDALARYFGVTIDYLLGRSDYPLLPDTSKIDGALETDPELLDFWRKLKKRPVLQSLARQAKDAPP